ncbi:MAG TPA: PRC-barrel domain-containing protein [Stellaceae bacterium]|nr:PRC-barrel domain-containing protein [Stellaceae bacterium]
MMLARPMLRGLCLAAPVAAAALLVGAGGKSAAPGAAPATSPAAAKAPDLHGATLRYVPADRIFPALDAEVKSAKGQDLGRIVEVLVDLAGRPRAAVIDFGGFLGVGSRKIAIEWSALQFGIGANRKQVISLDLGREQVKAAPAYEPDADRPVPVVTPPKAPRADPLPDARR